MELFTRTVKGHFDHEVFAYLFRDIRHHLIRFEPLFRQTIEALSYKHKKALKHNAAAMIFAPHNQSDIAEPSQVNPIQISKWL